jgi:O-antigen ligase
VIVTARSARSSADAVIGPALVIVLGCATVASMAALAAQQQTVALIAAGLAGAALLVVLAAGWVDALMVLVVTLPLPALYSAGDLRLSLAAPVTAVVVAAWFLSWGPSSRRLAIGTLPVLSCIAFLVAYLLAGAVSAHRGAALREIANLVLIGGLLVAATDTFVRRPLSAELVARTIAVVASIVGFLAALETLGIIPGGFSENGINRAALGFGQPNPLGMYLALSLPFVVHVRRRSGPGVARAMATAALCTTVVGLTCTFSRGSWLSVLAGTGVLLFAGERRLVLRVICAAFVAALVVDVGTGGAVHQRITGTLVDWSVAQRAALMLAGIQLFLEHPVLGAGPGAFAAELDRLGALVPTLWDLQATPHNAYIQIAAESGLVGLVIWIVLLAGLIRRGVRAVRHSTDDAAQTGLRRAALWTLAIFCALGMVVWPLSHGHAQIVVIAAAIVCAAPLRRSSTTEAHSDGKPAAISAAPIAGGAA